MEETAEFAGVYANTFANAYSRLVWFSVVLSGPPWRTFLTTVTET